MIREGSFINILMVSFLYNIIRVNSCNSCIKKEARRASQGFESENGNEGDCIPRFLLGEGPILKIRFPPDRITE